MDLIEFETNVEAWAHYRNLIEGTTPEKQFIKLIEEQGEVFDELFSRLDKTRGAMELGDMFVVLAILCAQKNLKFSYCYKLGEYLDWQDCTPERITVEVGRLAGGISKGNDELFAVQVGQIISDLFVFADAYALPFDQCAELVWNKIKDRKGRMIDGYYVKEDDIKQ